MSLSISEQVAKLGSGPLTEDAIAEHIRPLFSRVLAGEAERGEIYMANHSLGRPLDQTAVDVAEALDLWYQRMDECWDDKGWMGELERFRAGIAKLIGFSHPGCIVPKTSAGQSLRAVLNALPIDGPIRPIQVVATRGEFDSIDFILKVYQEKGRARVQWIEPTLEDDGVPLFDPSAISDAIRPGTDLVVVSQAMFTTGQLVGDMPNIVRTAHEAGALLFLDVYHAAGVVPLDVDTIGADFVAGGSYKYARGGPGACWLAISPSVLERGLRTLDTGWFAKKDVFAYRRPEVPEFASGGDAWMESTPAVLPLYQARAGLAFTLSVGVARLRAYSWSQLSSLRQHLRAASVRMFEPACPEEFGAFVLLPHPQAQVLAQRFKVAGLNSDARSGFIRLGPDLLNTAADLAAAAKIAQRCWQPSLPGRD